MPRDRLITIRQEVSLQTVEMYALRSAILSVQMAAMQAGQLTGIGRRYYKKDPEAFVRSKAAIDDVATEGFESTSRATSLLNLHVVAGEGEADGAPGLRDGQILDVGAPPGSPHVSTVIDPVEGTTQVATGTNYGVSAVAAAVDGAGDFMWAPDAYADKWVWSRRIAEARWRLLKEGKSYKGYDPRLSPFEQELSVVLEFMSYASGKPISLLTFEVLDRPRNQKMIDALFQNQVQVVLLDHGDFTASLNVVSSHHSTDASLGIGGSAEGLLTAAVSRVFGADYWQRVWIDPDDQPEVMRGKWLSKGVELDRIYPASEIAAGDVFFAVCGITPSIIDGVRFGDDGVAYTHTVYGRSSTGTVQYIRGEHSKPPLINKRELYEKYDLH